ncbi:Aspartyl protease family protein At5g10770 [Linum perenne]
MAIASSSIPHFILLALSLFSLLSLKPTNGDQQLHNFHNIELSSMFPSDSCVDLSSTKGNAMSSCSYDGPCHYIIQYEDSSFSKGYYSMEKLSLTSTDGVDEFFFGCGDNNQVNFSGAAGILGLGRDDLSLNHQASGKYNNILVLSPFNLLL